ncbi:MAG: DUF4012 domain-containing protein [Candidatus Pacebacteria bacterium]|nr:DUF4012 domain-containing protein [Candidatus Paceibacterota bacterium]
MPKLAKPLNFKLSTSTICYSLIAFSMSLIVMFTTFSLYKTNQSLKFVKNQQFTQASQAAHMAQPLPKLLSAITLRQSDTIKSWVTTLEIVESLPALETIINDISSNFFSSEQGNNSFIDLETELSVIQDKLTKLQTSTDSSLLLSNLNVTTKLHSLIKYNDQLLTILENINGGPHTILVLLQNTDEIRSSGGFMGSYARIDFDNGKIANITIQDIYEPDGQFAGYVDAPPGAKEYLSGGEGLRLPDSNWHPDFPTSAKIIASYFAFGNERKIDSIAAVNVDMIEKIIKVTGEIYLPDYGVTVTADNLTALARADRNSFFAGSKQKVNFLSILFDHLKIRLANLDRNQQMQLLEQLFISLEHKEIQLFSWHQPLQEIFDEYNFAGEIEYRDQSDFYLYLVESNVGINKANKKISREVDFSLGVNRTDIEIIFNNDDSESLLDYINYQRIILDPNVTVKEIQYDNQQIEFYKDTITNSTGQTFKQVGFLLPLESGQTKKLTVILNHPQICLNESCRIQIQNQSGLPLTPYKITFMDQTKNIILEKDEIIKFKTN